MSGACGTTWDDLAARALAELPGTEVSTWYRTPALKVRGKAFARLKEDGVTLVVPVNFEERLALLHSEPEAFFLTPHYQDHPYVLARLARVDADELHELLTEAWLDRAPQQLRTAWEAAR